MRNTEICGEHIAARYALSTGDLRLGSSGRLSTILYPTVDAAAREQQIAIQPIYGVPQARVTLRPLNLLMSLTESKLLREH